MKAVDGIINPPPGKTNDSMYAAGPSPNGSRGRTPAKVNCGMLDVRYLQPLIRLDQVGVTADDAEIGLVYYVILHRVAVILLGDL